MYSRYAWPGLESKVRMFDDSHSRRTSVSFQETTLPCMDSKRGALCLRFHNKEHKLNKRFMHTSNRSNDLSNLTLKTTWAETVAKTE